MEGDAASREVVATLGTRTCIDGSFRKGWLVDALRLGKALILCRVPTLVSREQLFVQDIARYIRLRVKERRSAPASGWSWTYRCLAAIELVVLLLADEEEHFLGSTRPRDVVARS